MLAVGLLSEALTGAQIDCTTIGEETQLIIERTVEVEPPAERNGTSH